MRKTGFLSLGFLALFCSYTLPARAEVIEVVFVTEIRNVSLGSFQVGEKSRQVITVDTDARTMIQEFSTGVTNVGIDLPSVRDDFEIKSKSFSSDEASFSVVGTTGSFVSFFGDIDYQFSVVLKEKSKTVEFSGCHNEYPSYSIIVDGKVVYDRVQSGAVLAGALLGDCDISVSLTSASF